MSAIACLAMHLLCMQLIWYAYSECIVTDNAFCNIRYHLHPVYFVQLLSV